MSHRPASNKMGNKEFSYDGLKKPKELYTTGSYLMLC